MAEIKIFNLHKQRLKELEEAKFAAKRDQHFKTNAFLVERLEKQIAADDDEYEQRFLKR